MNRYLAQKYLASMGCILIAGTTLPALAQESATQSDLIIEHIIVTANKREQSLQEVPMSVTALGKDFFEDSGLTSFQSLEQYTPNLKIQAGPDSRSTSIRIRGIGSVGSNAGIDPSVGVFIDGVYQARAGMAIGDLVDIERVEVLRGPQGTLYGKNTAAGAINIITQAPTESLEGKAEFVYANNNRKEFRGSVNLPIGESGDAARISGFAVNGDHLFKNSFNGEGINDVNKWGVKTRFLFNLDDSELLVNLDYSKEDTDCCALAVIDYNGFSPIMIGTPSTNMPSALIPGLPYVALETAPGSIGSPPQADPFGNNYWLNEQLSNDVEVAGISAEWGFDLENGDRFTFINAARSYQSASSYDGDFTAYNAATPADTTEDFTQFSSELRITSPSGQFWETQGGLYAFYSNYETEASLGIGEDVLLNSPQLSPNFPALSAMLGSQSVNYDSNKYETTSFAAFGQITANFTEKFSATLGLRITQEEKKRIGSQRTVRSPVVIDIPMVGPFPIPLPPFEVLPDLAPIAGADVDYDQDRLDTDFSPSLTARYFWNDDLMVYASTSQGFKSGGFDQRRVPIQQFGVINGGDDHAAEFEEESATNYELGWKSATMNNRLTFNGSLFFVDYEDFQAQAFDGASTKVTNAGSVESYGAELDATFLASKNFTIGTAIGYTKAEYKEFDNGQCTATDSLLWSLAGNAAVPCVTDLAGQPLDNVPEWTISSYAQHETSLSADVLAITRIEHNYIDEFYLDQDLDENLTNDAVNLVNLRFSLVNTERDLEVAFWANNILDEEYFLMGIDIPTLGGYAGVVAPQATYGITLRASFK